MAILRVRAEGRSRPNGRVRQMTTLYRPPPLWGASISRCAKLVLEVRRAATQFDEGGRGGSGALEARFLAVGKQDWILAVGAGRLAGVEEIEESTTIQGEWDGTGHRLRKLIELRIFLNLIARQNV